MSETTLPGLTDDEMTRDTLDREAGLGALRTERGLLPLVALDVRARLDGLLACTDVAQTFVNSFDVPLEATYIFPLPDRAAVTRFQLEVAGRIVEGRLQERGQARETYDRAIEAGHRAAIAEEERPGVFTLRVGNLPPGETATVRLSMAGPLPYADGEVTYRFPLVVAPRYVPGVALPGPCVGAGTSPDTDAAPDASRISPPVLLPGFPNPVRLSIEVELHESLAPVGAVRSSLHAVSETAEPGRRRIRIRPGERLDRDFVLRYRLGTADIRTALSVHPDSGPEAMGGTFALTVVPPELSTESAPAPRDVVFVLDRSGSMEGWKMVAARRAVARMVEALTPRDRFAVLAFDTHTESPAGSQALAPATDAHRFAAAEFLGKLAARGGTEMAEPLATAADLLAASEDGRSRLLVLVTDGQVANEDQILRTLAPKAAGLRVFTLGIDRAVNEGFLRRLSELGDGGGSSEVVETEERLEEAMEAIARRLGAPVLLKLCVVSGDPMGLPLDHGTQVPARRPDLFPGVPVLLLGRYKGPIAVIGPVSLHARTPDGKLWHESVRAQVREHPAIASVWARGRIRRLEDDYVIGAADLAALEREIVATSLQFGVLSRFTAYVAVDTAEVVNAGGVVHQVVQAVEAPQGWAMLAAPIRALAMGGPPPAARSVSRRSGATKSMPLHDLAESDDMELQEFLPSSPPSGGSRGKARSKRFLRRIVEPFRPHEAAPTPPPPALADETLRAEAAGWLREMAAVGAPDDRLALLRRIVVGLADRIVPALERQGAPADAIQQVRALVARLEAVAGKFRGNPAKLQAAWDELTPLLTTLAGDTTPTPPARGTFWK